jgi:hypothetical protein
MMAWAISTAWDVAPGVAGSKLQTMKPAVALWFSGIDAAIVAG